MNTIFIVLPILTLLMFDLGLALRPKDFRLIVEQPKAVLAGLTGQILLLPLIAWGVASGFQLEPLFFLGLMLIACSPGGSSSNVFSMLAGGNVALSVSLTALSSVITLFTGPFIMDIMTRQVGSAMNVHLPVGNLLMQNLVLMAVPIAIGLWIAVRNEQLAERMHAVLKKLAFPLLLVLITVFYIQNREIIMHEFPALGLCVTVLIGMQNAAQAITVASSPFVFNNDVMAIPAIIYSLMMNVVLLTYVGIIKRQTVSYN